MAPAPVGSAPPSITPNDRYLYDMKVPLVKRSGQVVDEVSSYAGLRTIRTVSDAQGRPRIALNGNITFLHGPLDEGYWPDGIYTAPTDAALNFDLEQMKALGNEFRPQAVLYDAGLKTITDLL